MVCGDERGGGGVSGPVTEGGEMSERGMCVDGVCVPAWVPWGCVALALHHLDVA